MKKGLESNSVNEEINSILYSQKTVASFGKNFFLNLFRVLYGIRRLIIPFKK
jgi:hypothetical protein